MIYTLVIVHLLSTGNYNITRQYFPDKETCEMVVETIKNQNRNAKCFEGYRTGEVMSHRENVNKN